MEDLLPYYEKQLQEFSHHSRLFAQKYPALAQRLSLNQEQVDDPHIERLIQAFSLIAARTEKKLADSYDVFTHALFEVMFPQYLKHFPACTVVSFEDEHKQKKLTDAHLIPAQTILKSRSIKGVQCEFTTTVDTELLPLKLHGVHFKANHSTHIHQKQNAVLSLEFEVFNAAQHWLAERSVPVYLDAGSGFPLQVMDSIFRTATLFVLKAGTERLVVKNPFSVMGFDENQSLLPVDQHTHHAYRLLMEYFCFPEKFSFLNLNLNMLKQLKYAHQYFEIEIHTELNLSDQTFIHNYAELHVSNFRLFCTPAVNLFRKQSEPQKINHRQLQYPLLTDIHHPECYRLYAVLEMNMIREKTGQDQVSHPVLPFFGMSHYQHDGLQFYYSLNMPLSGSASEAVTYSIMSRALEPQNIRSDFISAGLLCSNGNLPHEVLRQQNNILYLNQNSLVRQALILKQPDPPYFFSKLKQEQWRIISHLSLNTLSFMKGDALAHLKELMELYNLPASAENQQVLYAIQKISFSQTTRMMNIRPFPAFVRGIKAELWVDAHVFRGRSLYIFSQIISHVLSLKVQINSFVDVHILDAANEQELYQCLSSNGGKQLL